MRDVSNLLEGEKYPTLAYVYPLMNKLATILTQTHVSGTTMFKYVFCVSFGGDITNQARVKMKEVLFSKWRDHYVPLGAEFNQIPVFLNPVTRASAMYDFISQSDAQRESLRSIEQYIVQTLLPEPESEPSSSIALQTKYVNGSLILY